MAKNTAISQSTLCTGFLLNSTMMALSKARAVRNQNKIAVILMLQLASLSSLSFSLRPTFRVLVLVRDQQVLFLIDKSFPAIVGRRKSLAQIDRILGASLFTKPAEDAAQHIDLVFGRVF